MKKLFKNWKTTSAGLLSIAGGIVLYTGDKTKLMESLTAIMAGIGLLVSKDHDKTGV